MYFNVHLVMTNIAMERSTMLLIGKLSISMGYLYHGELLNNQSVLIAQCWHTLLYCIVVF